MCGLLKCYRNILQVSGIKQDVHGHVEHYIQNDNTEHVVDMELGCLFHERHHQYRERHEHSADYIEVAETVELACVHVAGNCIAHQ